MTLELIAFLRARLDEDEPLARLIEDRGHWRGIHVDSATEVAVHIERHRPARVLREVEAKRGILAEHQHRDFDRPNSQYCEVCHADDGNPAVVGEWCLTLRLLALPYTSHADYREEWRP